MTLEYQTSPLFILFLLLHLSVNGQAFIICPPKALRFVPCLDYGSKWQFPQVSKSSTVRLVAPQLSRSGERGSFSRLEATNDPDPIFFGAKMNEELDDIPKNEWHFVRGTITRLTNLINAVRKFVWTSFHRLLVVRFIWLLQTTASLKSVLLDSTRSFSSSRPQVRQFL
jgi:hypothetical protein